MEHYIEINLLPDPEFAPSVLMNALFTKLHRALVEGGRGLVGVSFPKAQKTLGDVIRLHGGREDIQRLIDLNWLKSLTDYISVSAITPVPGKCKYRVVKRVQVKSSSERLYRRSVNKGRLTTEKAEQKIANSKEQRLKDPFVQITSQSTGQKYRLFIRQGDLLDSPRAGKFSAYGLSNEATIPWF